jgi:hypothetical protein
MRYLVKISDRPLDVSSPLQRDLSWLRRKRRRSGEQCRAGCIQPQKRVLVCRPAPNEVYFFSSIHALDGSPVRSAANSSMVIGVAVSRGVRQSGGSCGPSAIQRSTKRN